MKDTLVINLLEKSKEAFIMAIEIYNKPTLKYRLEGFALFICNAWELMIKAHMINQFGEHSIYYKDSPDRTLSLEGCIKKIFTNDKDPLRLNLEKIIELRNTSTHFITQEYEMVYIPLFQACVLNFNEKILAFHQIDMTELIPQNFLTLSISMKALDEAEIIAKYPEQISKHFVDVKSTLEDLAINNNAKFAIRIDHYHYITKDKDKATDFVHISKDATSGVAILKELKDPNNTHKFTAKLCIEKIQELLKKDSVMPLYNGIPAKFTMFHFINFCRHFGLKKDERYCYPHMQFSAPQYTYAQQIVDFIVAEIKKDPENILDNIKK